MDKQNIYIIGIVVSYDIYSSHFIFRFLNKFIKRKKEIMWMVPVLGFNEEDAIQKYSKRYKINNAIPYVYEGKITNIIREIKCINTKHYNLNILQENMISEDFLHYCKQELGLEQTINNIIKH